MKIRFFIFSLISISFLLINTSCKKEKFNSTGNLAFSVDTLLFDTVFTTIGSTTQQFKIYNTSKSGVKIEEIQLMGGSSSPFRINVDGLKGTSHSDIELEGGDSLFVFVEVTLGVNNQSLPLIVEDSIRFRTNGTDQYIILAVWGQDAYFHHKDVVSPTANDTTWSNDKPHVVYDFAAVDSAKTLTIEKGAKIYFHKNSMLWIYKGALHVDGELDNEVIFQGDRLESYYADVSGQWYGIYFQEARPSTINYAIIKNGTAGIHTFSSNETNTDYTVTVTNTKILNHASYGVFEYTEVDSKPNSAIKMENCVLAKCYRNAFLVLEGGDFNLNHCDILGYGDSKEQNIAFAVKNNFVRKGKTYVGAINEGKIYNSVIYGYQTDEFALDTLNPNGSTPLNFDFKNNLIKKETPSTHTMFQQIIWNTAPGFKDIVKYDFTFPSTSILNGNGVLFSSIFDNDIEGITRGNPPDIGAYELP